MVRIIGNLGNLIEKRRISKIETDGKEIMEAMIDET